MLPQHRHGMSTLLTRHTQHASTKLRTLIPVASVAQPSSTSTSQTSKAALLEAVSLADRGLLTDSAVRKCIDDAISSLEASSNGRCTTSNELSATWKLLYTTEKETLFILEKAGAFGTKAGDVFQVGAGVALVAKRCGGGLLWGWHGMYGIAMVAYWPGTTCTFTIQ